MSASIPEATLPGVEIFIQVGRYSPGHRRQGSRSKTACSNFHFFGSLSDDVGAIFPASHTCFFRRLISAAIIDSSCRKESRRALASASFQATSAWSF